MPFSQNFYGAIDGRKITADFSQLTWYAQKTEPVKRIMNKVWDKTKFNPWYNARLLIRSIADMHELPPEAFILTNSSAEAIYLIAQAFRNAEASIFIPTRNEYEAACKANKHHLNFILKNKLVHSPPLPGGLTFISHPNNLDGSTVDIENMKKLLQLNTNTLLVADQTYIDYIPEDKRLNTLLKAYSNLLIVESISQSFGFPGLPIGYIAGPPKIIEKLWMLKPPHTYNAIAIETARYVLMHSDEFKIPIETFLKEKQSFQERLKAIPHLKILESNAPFFTVQLLKGTAKALTRYLWQNYSVIVKDVTTHRGIDTENIRLIVRDNKETFLLLKGLKAYLAEQ